MRDVLIGISGYAAALISLLGVSGCLPQQVHHATIPSLDYTRALQARGIMTDSQVLPVNNSGGYGAVEMAASSAGMSGMRPSWARQQHGQPQSNRAQLRFASEGYTAEPPPESGLDSIQVTPGSSDTVSNLNGATDFSGPGDGVYTYRSQRPNIRDYTGPLHLGDPGVSSSLWKESRGANDLFRDVRAFYPMDLLTIVVDETDEGKKEANTEIKSKSSLLAGVTNFLGLTDQLEKANPSLTPLATAVQAETQNDFKGEGKTNRKGSLTGTISAMVVEVLPSGILRIEGEKIVAVNNEEQVMVISGLVRPRDINADNEVPSAKVGNMRIDYYGDGTVGEAQYGGWLGRMLRIAWPF